MDETTLGVAQAGLGAASLIPGVGPFAAIAGLGLSAFGAVGKAQAAKKQAQASQEVANLEMKQDAVRKRAMEMQAHRQQLEILRSQQRAQALAVNNANNQGAMFGSGLQGGLGQISGYSNFNLQGVDQALASGEQMFGLNAQISQQKINIAKAGGQAATATGLASLGGTLTSSAPTLKNLAGNLGGTSANPNTYGSFIGGLGSNGIY